MKKIPKPVILWALTVTISVLSRLYVYDSGPPSVWLNGIIFVSTFILLAQIYGYHVYGDGYFTAIFRPTIDKIRGRGDGR